MKLAAITFPTVACVSYAVQRLAALTTDPGLSFGEAHTPYYGRVALAGLHGAMLAVLVGVLVPERHALAARWVVPALVLPSAVAMALWP